MKLPRLLCLLVVMLPIASIAQIDIDVNWKKRYMCEVKSLDEFAARFNLQESHPDVQPDSMSDYSNIYALFDFDNIMGKADELSRLDDIYDFCDSIFCHDIKFAMENGGVIVEADCDVKLKNKKGSVSIFFKTDKTAKGFDRWSIISVTGLEKTGIIDMSRLSSIAPTEHEMHFMGLKGLFNLNRDHALGFRNAGHELDQTTLFLSLIYSGMLDFGEVKDVQVHCIDVPGFIFTIKECVRHTNNSGWLITTLERKTIEEKMEFMNNILNKK